MKKFFTSISKRDLIFISAIFAMLMVLIFRSSSVNIWVNSDEEMLYITSPRQNMDIPKKDISAVELVARRELGTCVDGFSHEQYCCGVWENDLWGEYDLCVIPEQEHYIVLTLKSGRKIVFTASTNEKTKAVYEAYGT